MTTPVDLPHKLFLALAGLLLGFGLLMVHSASITSWPTEFEHVYLSKHLLFLAVGLIAATVAASLPPAFWKAAAPWLFLATVILLVAVLVPGIGSRVKGAQRWIRILGYSLQPSELAKITLPLMLCTLIDFRRDRLGHWWSGTVPILWPAVLVVPLVLVQPDLGTAAFLLAGTGIVLLAAGWPLRNFVLSLGAVAPALLGVLVLKPYQRQRIVGFMETWSDFDSAPYQIKQSLVTLGSGGLFGVGLGRGWQKLSFLPEANTDFVFAVVGEELGLVGTLSLIALWCGLYLSGLRLLSPLKPRSFGMVAGFTLLTQLVAQAALNIAVVTAMVPPKGISLPLVSYGGSNLLVSLLSLGIVLSLAREIPAQSEAPPQ